MVVIDASVAVEALMNAGPSRDLLRVETLYAPHLIDSEVVSALRRAVLAGSIAAPTGADAIVTWQRATVHRRALPELLPRVWELRDTVSAYDAGYVALAESLGCALVTRDARLARAPGPRCPVTVLPR